MLSKTRSAPPTIAPTGRRRNTGLLGAAFFIVSESSFFLGLFLAYFSLRSMSQIWPPPNTPPLSLILPAINTIILAASVIFIAWAERGIARDNARRLQVGVGVAASLGLVFMAVQTIEIAGLGFAPYSSAYGSAFFFLMGFHIVRVFAGVAFMTIVLVRAFMGQFSADRRAAVQACALYWYFIASVWLVVFYVLYVGR